MDGRPGDLAPGLALVQEFINTLDLAAGVDLLANDSALHLWLQDRGLLGLDDEILASDLERARSMREALRALASANAGGPFYPMALSILNREARSSPLTVRFLASGRSRLTTGPGLAGALAGLLAAVHQAMADQTWSRLKACRDPGCRRAFYDRSRNSSRAWCSMAGCGNRAKALRHRRRLARRESGPEKGRRSSSAPASISPDFRDQRI